MKKLCVALISLTIIFIFSFNAYSGCWKVTDKDGNITIVSDLWNSKEGEGENKISMIEGYVNNACVSIPLDKIHSIIIMKRSGHWGEGEIILKSGTRGKFGSSDTIYMISDFGKSRTWYGWIKSITLCDESITASANPTIDASKYDTVIMKNGDVLSGKILTEQFVLKTSYASLTIKTRDIESINLEGGGQNIETVQLRTGDRISGVIENKTVKIKLPIGSQVTLEKDKIKLINFKKVK